jgi:hypothetical protein
MQRRWAKASLKPLSQRYVVNAGALDEDGTAASRLKISS